MQSGKQDKITNVWVIPACEVLLCALSELFPGNDLPLVHKLIVIAVLHLGGSTGFTVGLTLDQKKLPNLSDTAQKDSSAS